MNFLRTSPAFACAVWLGAAGAAADESNPVKRVEAMIQACELEPARGLVDKHLKGRPDDANALSALGLIKLREGDAAGAIETLEQAVARHPDLAEGHHRLAQAFLAHVNDVGMFSLMGIAKRAFKAANRSVELKPGSIEHRMLLLQFYAAAPGFVGGDIDKAQEQATAIAALDPAEGLFARALVAFSDGEKDQAGELLQQAADKGHLEAQRNLAGVHAEAERWDAAFSAVDGVLEKEPANLPALSMLGHLSAKSGQQSARGEKALKTFLGNPRSLCQPGGKWGLAHGHYNLGTIYQKTARKDEARREYETALKLQPKLDDARDALEELDDKAPAPSGRPR